MSRRKVIPQSVEAEVLIQSKRRCSLCFGIDGNQNEQKGQIAHINQDPSNNSFDNLVFLCFNHHDAYDSQTSQSKGYTESELKHHRKMLYNSLGSKQPVVVSTNIVKAPKQKMVTQEMLEYLWDDIYQLVYAGFVPKREVASEIITMYASDYDSKLITPYVKIIAQKLLAEHKRQQKSWPKITDCNRLDLAFAELERNGILSRQDFADCTSCGYNEINDEIDKEESKGRQIRGFTFYHQQDTAHAVNDGDIYLGYGSTKDDESADIKIGREIVATIEKHGLKAFWNNSINQRICVVLNWKRRR